MFTYYAVCFARLSSGKNMMLVTPPSNDLWSVLDTLKQADISLFLLPVMEPVSPEGLTLLKTAKEQGLCTPFVGVGASINKTEEKAFLKSVQKYLPSVEKVFSLTNAGQISNLLRMMSVHKITIPKQWTLRSSFFIENFCPVPIVEPETLHPNYVTECPDGNTNLLEVTGVVRRKNLDPHKPLLISGHGTFQILRIDVTPQAIPKEFISSEQEIVASETLVPAPPPRFLLDPLSVPVEAKDDEPGDNEHDMDSDMDDFDDEDFEDADDDDGDTGSQMSMEDGEGKKKKRKVPKGTSDYQADWLVNSDGEADGEIVGSDEELEKSEDEAEDEGNEEDDEEDNEMDWEEEKRQIQITKGKLWIGS
jgi:pre-rRNA-processing protein TSR1